MNEKSVELQPGDMEVIDVPKMHFCDYFEAVNWGKDSDLLLSFTCPLHHLELTAKTVSVQLQPNGDDGVESVDKKAITKLLELFADG